MANVEYLCCFMPVGDTSDVYHRVNFIQLIFDFVIKCCRSFVSFPAIVVFSSNLILFYISRVLCISNIYEIVHRVNIITDAMSFSIMYSFYSLMYVPYGWPIKLS